MKRWKQILSLLLCLCMLVSYFPDLAVHSHAEEEETAPTIEVETEITEPEEPEEPEEVISEEPEEVVPEENEEDPEELPELEAFTQAEESVTYPWDGMTDEEFAEWVMAEDNRAFIESILNGNDDVLYDALTVRVEELGDDLHEQVAAYLMMLISNDSTIYTSDSLNALASTSPVFPLKANTANMYIITYGGGNESNFNKYGTDWYGGHHGTEYFAMDISGSGAGEGTAVYAVADGTVVQVWETYGLIILKHTTPLTLSDGVTTYDVWYSTYCHMKNLTVKLNSIVTQNQKIGEVSNVSTDKISSHLHFSMTTKLHNGKYEYHYSDNHGTTPTFEIIMGYANAALNPKWVFPDKALNVKPNGSDKFDAEAVKRFSLDTSYAPGNINNGRNYLTKIEGFSIYDGSLSGITTTSAVFSAKVYNPKNEVNIDRYGVFYYKSDISAIEQSIKTMNDFTNATLPYLITKSYTGNNSLEINTADNNGLVHTLAPATKYYARFWVCDSSGKMYWQDGQMEFTTKSDNSVVTFTNTGHSLETTNSARVSATWQNPDRITLTHGGVIYGKSSLVNMTPTYAQLTADTWSNSNCLRFIENVKKGYENSASERMYYDLNNLSPGTEYHARVFMIDEFKKVHMQSGETVFSTTSRCTTHTWDSGKVTKAASCKETGVKTYTCTVCGGTKTETIDKTTNHSWGSWTKVDGTNHKRTCSVCSAAESAVHNYSYVEDPKPTFTTTGTITGTCGACRNVITDTFPVISEKDYVRSIFKEPTYTEQGEERWTWKNTAYGDRHFHFPIPKLVPVSKITLNYTEKTLCKDQEFTLSATVTPSDAANTGVHWKTSNANVATRNYNTQLVHANGVGTAVFTAEADDYQGAVATCTVRVVDHAYTYVVTTAPTTSAAGTLTGTCSGCNGTTTVTLPKLDTTNYTYSVVKAPSATAEGTGRYTWKTTTYGTFYFDVVLEKTGITGTCGTNLTWTLTNTGVLTISGTGEMENYAAIVLLGGKRAPWYDYRTDIVSVVIENGVTSIGNYAFNGCSSLSGVTIAASVTGIGGNAFAGCTALRSIEIPANVSSIAATAFANCSALTAIQVNANNKTYTSVDGILFTKDKTTLVRYPLGKTGAYRIPDSVTAVGNYAFSGCTGLTDITIPNSVVSIGSNAFSGCSALNHVYFDGIQKEWDAIEKDSAGLPENIEVEYIHVHNFTYVVAKEPGTALFATGRLTGTCSGCSEEKTVVLPRLTATDYNYSVIKETTCLADGTGRYTWKNTTYGTFYFDVTIPAPGHSYSYKATTAPTTSAAGTLTGTCAKCGDTTTVTLPKLDTTNYTYSEIQAATETATGIGRYTWKNTDYGTFTFDVVIPKLEPQTQRGDLNGDGKVTDLDVSALLRHILFPARYEIIGDADFNKDGKLTDADAGYLLKHTLFPTRYPL